MEKLISITNDLGTCLILSNIGAGIYDITIMRNGHKESLLVHPKDAEEYFYSDGYFGKCCGRYAGRISNSQFTLNGKCYSIKHDASSPHVLHGGVDNISFKQFLDVHFSDDEKESICFTYFSPDGESGFPGNLRITITYELYRYENKVNIIHEVISDQDTVCNLTSHMYFNLTGLVKKKILDEVLFINSKIYGKASNDALTVSLEPVDTNFDFSYPHKIKEHIYEDDVQRTLGYNHPYMLNHAFPNDVILMDKENEITMKMNTTYDCLFLYTCNYPSSLEMNTNRSLEPYDAVCLEFEHLPNSINLPFVEDKKDVLKANIKSKNSITISIEVGNA